MLNQVTVAENKEKGSDNTKSTRFVPGKDHEVPSAREDILHPALGALKKVTCRDA